MATNRTRDIPAACPFSADRLREMYQDEGLSTAAIARAASAPPPAL